MASGTDRINQILGAKSPPSDTSGTDRINNIVGDYGKPREFGQFIAPPMQAFPQMKIPPKQDFLQEYSKQAAVNELNDSINRTWSDPTTAAHLQFAMAGVPDPNYTQDSINKAYSELDSLEYKKSFAKKAYDTTDYDKLIKEKQAAINLMAKYVPNAKLRSETEMMDASMRALSNFALDVYTTAIKNPANRRINDSAMAIAKLITGKDTPYSPLDAADDLLLRPLREDIQRANQNIENTSASRGKGYQAWNEISGGVVGALPHAALAIATGGVGAATALPALGGNAGLGTAITGALSNMVKTPMFAASFTRTYGSAYNTAIESGASVKEAELAAIIVGIINSGVELTGGLETLPAILKSDNTKAIYAWVKSTLAEGKEEVVQGIIERLTEKVVYDTEKPLAPNYKGMSEAKELGQFGKGNIDLTNRPSFKNPDGSTSTVDSTSFNVDGKEVLIPTVWTENGKVIHGTPDEALERYFKTGQYLGKFDTVNEANAYAQKLHAAQEYIYVSKPNNQNAVFNPIVSLQEGGMGTAIGGILGGGQVLGTGLMQNAAANKPAAQDIGLNTESNTTGSVTTPQDAPQALQAPTAMSAPKQAQAGAQGNAGGQGAMPDGLGAADVMFDPFSNMQNQKSQFHPVGESATRDVEIPTTDLDDTNISRSVRTVMEAQATPDAAIPAIENATVRGDFSYMSITDDMSKTRAQDVVKYKGWDAALRDWTADVRRGVVSKDTVALGATLYNNAINSGNTKLAIDILTDYVANIRAGAQATQAARLLKQMSPEYQLYAVQRSVANLQMELMQKYNDKAPNLVVDPALATAYLDALTSKAAKDIKAAKSALYKSIADQLPSTFADKWNAWRYLSMLGNFRTHIRNIAGNAGFTAVRLPKNIIATSLEYTTDGATKLVNKLFGTDHEINRTKAFLNYLKGADRDYIKLGLSDYANVQEQILSGGKFSDVRNEIESYKRPFKNSSDWGKRTHSGKAARGARAVTDVMWQGTNAVQQGSQIALDVEDAWFAAPAYAKALASYLKANRVKAEDFANGTMSAERIDKARATAIVEAQKATYRDFNDFSNFVSRLGRGYTGNNKAAKAANVLVEGVLPFRRTPANILARGVEYSPIGLLKGLTYDLYQVSKGNKTAAEAIDQIAAGLTGTALLGLGVLLAKMGLVRGASSDDDKENALDDLQGHQDYALQIGGKSITLDWLAPEAIPFFVGVEMFAASEHEGEMDLKAILNAAAKISDPILETSMLQSLQDLINSASYSDNGLYNMLATAAINYISQGLPTMAGQIERITEQNRESTYIDKTSGTPSQVQATLGKMFNKIPGYDYQQREYTDAFGRTQPNGNVAERVFNNMFNPAYVSDIVKTPVDEEIKRLYQDGALDAVPQQPDKYFSYNSTKYNMSAQEYDRFAKTRGQLVYEQINALISSSGYKDFTDEEKATEIKQLIDFATDQAKKQLVESRRETYKSETRFNDLTAAFDAGIAIDDYYKAYNLYKSLDKDGGLKASEKANVFAYQIDSQFGNLAGAQKELLKENMNYYTIIPAEATRYEKFTEAGLTDRTANALTTALSALKPLVGKESVSDLQKYNTVANAKVSEADKLKALSALMDKGPYDKMQTALGSGLPLKQYMAFLNATSEFESSKDANGNDIKGQTKQYKVWAYINSLKISREQKNALHFAAGYAETSLGKAPW